MAARTSRTELHEKWRAKIKASMLLNRLRDHALGKVEMTPTQVRAAEILLKKSLPDLQSIEHSGGITMMHEQALGELDTDG